MFLLYLWIKHAIIRCYLTCEKVFRTSKYVNVWIIIKWYLWFCDWRNNYFWIEIGNNLVGLNLIPKVSSKTRFLKFSYYTLTNILSQNRVLIGRNKCIYNYRHITFSLFFSQKLLIYNAFEIFKWQKFLSNATLEER